MALGTPTLKSQAHKSFSRVVFFDRITLAGDSAYTAGGSAGFAAYFQGLVSTETENAQVGSVNYQPFAGRTPLEVLGFGGVYRAQYDATNDKLQVFNTSTGAEAGNGDLSGTTFDLLVISN